MPAWKIAEQEGVDASQICRDLDAMRGLVDVHDTDTARRALAQRTEAIARYEEVIGEAFAEWERSKLDKQRRREKATKKPGKVEKPKAGKAPKPTPGQETIEAEQSTEGRLGEAQLLRVVVEAQKQIDAINGLVKQRHEHSGLNGAPLFKLYGFDPDKPDAEDAAGS